MEIWFKYKKLVRDYVRYDAKNKIKKKKKTQKKIKVATSQKNKTKKQEMGNSDRFFNAP